MVFGELVSASSLAGEPTLLEALGAVIAGHLAVVDHASIPVVNRAAPGAALAQGEGVPCAGAGDTAGGYLQQPLRARSRPGRHAVCSRPGAGRKQCAALPQRGRDPGITQ